MSAIRSPDPVTDRMPYLTGHLISGRVLEINREKIFNVAREFTSDQHLVSILSIFEYSEKCARRQHGTAGCDLELNSHNTDNACFSSRQCSMA